MKNYYSSIKKLASARAGAIAATSFSFLILHFTFLISSFSVNYPPLPAEDHPTLTIGAKAPPFSLMGVDGKIYTLASFKNAKLLVIVFTCNHCPTAQAYEERLIKLTRNYRSRGASVVAIM